MKVGRHLHYGPNCPTTGKRSFYSRADARRYTRHLGDDQRCYRCPDCGFVHLTSAPRRRAA